MAATNVQAFSGDVEVASNLAVDTNTLFVDSVNSRVGIGVTLPQEKLDVAGTAPYLSITDTRTSSGGTTGLDLGGIVFRTKDTTDPSPETGDFLAKIQVTAQNAGSFPDGSLNFFVSDDGDLLSSPSMVIEGVTGNVGIGTDGPYFQTDIAYSGTADINYGLNIHNTYNSGTSNRMNTILFSDSNSTQGAIGGYRVGYANHYLGGLVFYIGSQPNGYNQGKPTGASDATQSLTEAMRIRENGNVGIGIANPQRPLHVSGDSWVSGVMYDGYIASDRARSVKKYVSGVNVASLSTTFKLGDQYKGGILKVYMTAGVSGENTTATVMYGAWGFNWGGGTSRTIYQMAYYESQAGNITSVTVASDGVLTITGTMYSSFSYPLMEVEVYYAGGIFVNY
jgi:hypothetical protein